MTMDTDVIVIGAGVAGLAAAAKLAHAGFEVRLVEARGRIGGRILTERPAGWSRPVELGAEFIHAGNASLGRWLKTAGLKKRPIEERHWRVTDGKREPVNDAWERIDATMRKIGPRFRGSFAEWIERHGDRLATKDRELAMGFVTGFQAARPGAMSAKALYEAAQTEDEQFRPSGGYDALVHALERRARRDGTEIELASPVTRVRWRRGWVEVEASRGKWQARAAIVTVPPGVLCARKGGLGFRPALVAKSRVWRSVKMGHARRVMFRLRADAWTRGAIPPELRAENGHAFGFLHSTEMYFPVWWAEAPHPILVGWTGGAAAEKMAGWTANKVVREAMKTLAKLLDRERSAVEKLVVEARTHDWSADPFTRAGYSFAAVGGERLPRQLAQPVGGTLFFAGEATADLLELGTVHGALSSGERAADEVIAAKTPRLRDAPGR